jgi:stage V sporulation protein K
MTPNGSRPPTELDGVPPSLLADLSATEIDLLSKIQDKDARHSQAISMQAAKRAALGQVLGNLARMRFDMAVVLESGDEPWQKREAVEAFRNVVESPGADDELVALAKSHLDQLTAAQASTSGDRAPGGTKRKASPKKVPRKVLQQWYEQAIAAEARGFSWQKREAAQLFKQIVEAPGVDPQLARTAKAHLERLGGNATGPDGAVTGPPPQTSTSRAVPQPPRRRAAPRAEPDRKIDTAVATPGLQEELAELQRMIGLESVKLAVRSYANFVQNQQRRKALGLKASSRSSHLVFVGPPGTGKTTVARLLGRILGALGVLEHGDVVEVARADLVAEFLGQTAVKTNTVIDRALGRVLFIDEAYALVPDGPNQGDSYGREAIDTLMKRMEDDREKFVLIVAGYERPMKRFLEANPGLRSRFDETISFPDYGPSELLEVLQLFVESGDYELTPAAHTKAAAVLEQAWRARDESFGNARLVRNLFEDATRAQSDRLAQLHDVDAATMRRLEEGDIPNSA